MRLAWLRLHALRGGEALTTLFGFLPAKSHGFTDHIRDCDAVTLVVVVGYLRN